MQELAFCLVSLSLVLLAIEYRVWRHNRTKMNYVSISAGRCVECGKELNPAISITRCYTCWKRKLEL